MNISTEYAGLKEIRRALRTRGDIDRRAIERMGVKTFPGPKRGRGRSVLIRREDLPKLNGSAPVTKPQADKLDRIIDLLERLLAVWEVPRGT